MPKKIPINIGDKFNKLEIIEILPNYKLKCKCDCGNICIKYKSQVLKAAKTGCGRDKCFFQYKHGLANKRIFHIWIDMKTRCYNSNHQSFHRYGNRGIKIYQKWLDDFMNFYNWAMANGYQDDLTIERKDNDGDYCPENCKWVSRKQQARNRRTNIIIEAFGEKKHLIDWSKDYRCKVCFNVIRNRLKQGISPEDAITKPPFSIRKQK